MSKPGQKKTVSIIKQTQKNIETEASEEKIVPLKPEWFSQFLDNCKDVDSKLHKVWSRVLQEQIHGKSDTSPKAMTALNKMNFSDAIFFNRFLQYTIRSFHGQSGFSHFMYYEKYKTPGGFPDVRQISSFLEMDLITQIVNEHIVEPTTFINNPKTRVGQLGEYSNYILFVYFKPNQTHLVIPALFLSQVGAELSKFVGHESVGLSKFTSYKLKNVYLSYLLNLSQRQGFQLKALSLHKKHTTLKAFIGGRCKRCKVRF